MAQVDFSDLFPRLGAMCKEATVTDEFPTGAESVECLACTLDNFPYFSFGFGDMTFDESKSDTYTDLYIIRMRLVVAHYTEGYDGAPEKYIGILAPAIRRYFAGKTDLVTTAAGEYHTSPDYLDWSWRLEGGIGTAYFQETPYMPVQVGTEFRLRLRTTDYL